MVVTRNVLMTWQHLSQDEWAVDQTTQAKTKREVLYQHGHFKDEQTAVNG